MDKIESVAVFILAILVAIGPLAMLADLLWRKRGADRYIVEVWNADHTRLIRTIMTKAGDRIPPNGERFSDREELDADEPQEPPEAAEGVNKPGRREQRKSLERGDGSHCFASKRKYHVSLNQRTTFGIEGALLAQTRSSRPEVSRGTDLGCLCCQRV
jgi:hypothetical protein